MSAGRLPAYPYLDGALPEMTRDLERMARATERVDRATEQKQMNAVLPSDAPLAIAKHFIATRYGALEGRRLHYWRGDFYRWTGSHYSVLAMDAARSELYEWLDDRAGKPTKRTVDNVLDALRAAAFLDARPPCWLTEAPPITGELIACRNGLVQVGTRELHDPTPAYFNLNACDFDYQPDAPRPEAWLDFLGSVWGDEEIIAVLQEVFGLILTGDTSQQKIILIIGPKRSGKGTIARVLRAINGAENTAAPTLAGLGQNFGLAGLIGKPLAIISDARLSGRSDLAAVTENLLRISGEDGVSVPRKFQADWVGQLPTRFLMLTNELPALTDSSGALASRFVGLPMTRSFYGCEDPKLTSRLLGELPGIFSWALDGLARLRQRGHLVQPAAGEELLEQLDRLASPVKAFVADCCVIEPAAEIACSDLYAAWAAWCQTQHRDHPGNVAMFGRHLRAAFPLVATRQPRRGGERHRVFAGIRCREAYETDEDASGTRWHASQTNARVSECMGSRERNSPDRVPSRSTIVERIADIARQAGIPPDRLTANLTPDDLTDAELMQPERLLLYARGLVQ